MAGYISKGHGFKFVLVMLLIIVSSYASVQSMSLMEDLALEIGKQLDAVNLYGLQPEYGGILSVIIKMVIIFVCGILASAISEQLNVVIAQSVLRDVRDTMFAKMQRLPIKYFDTHTFGETM